MIEIVSVGHGLWAVTQDGEFAGALRWYGEHMRFCDPEGIELGALFRSDGKIRGGVTTYTWRAYLPGPGGAEVARGASQEDAAQAVLDARVTA